MQIQRLAGHLARAVTAALTIAGTATPAAAQGHDAHAGAAAQPRTSSAQQNALVAAVRAATERLKGVTSIDGPGEGYALTLGCGSGGDFGAMGLHYLNGGLVGDGEIDVTQPEVVLFEPTENGGIRITGADYLVFAADWDAKHAGPPQLMGQLFHLFDAPNRFGLPAFYTLHVWAWKENPNGTFANWNPNVSCDAFNSRGAASLR
jgi:hypothetical protein